MKQKSKLVILGIVALMLASISGSALATEMPSAAVVMERIWNDSFASVLTIDNSYPSVIDINDQCAGPLGWANLHLWRLSADGANPQEFGNTDGFIISAEVTLMGTGDGEGGLQIAPWWSQTDGRFNLRTPDGEVACFGGRLPFYSFTGSHGVTYVKGTTVRLTMIYTPNTEMDETAPATIEYIYNNGSSYSSGPLPFDEGNPGEPNGTWGILSPAYVGGHMQYNNMSGAGDGANFNVIWGDIIFEDMGSVVDIENTSMGSLKALFR